MGDSSPGDAAAASVVKDAAAVVENAAAVVQDAAAIAETAAPAVDRRRRPRRARHHEARVAWKHIAIYVPVVLVVTLLGALAIWSFIGRQSLVIAPEPLPRVTLVTADARSPLTAAWVRLLNKAEVEPT